MNLKWLVLALFFAACQKNELTSEFTGNQASFGLMQTSQYAASGLITFKERKDGRTTVVLSLSGTTGADLLPVHLHNGDLAGNGIAIVAQLSPVNAKTGVSETILSQLADETKVTYKDLLKISAYVNVHASSSGPESGIILVAGNIGSNGAKIPASSGRIGNCTGK